MQVGDLVSCRLSVYGQRKVGIVLKLRKRHARVLWRSGLQEWYERPMLGVINASR